MLNLESMKKESIIISKACQTLTYHNYTPSGWEIVDGNVIGEGSVSLTVNGELWLSFMCTATDLQALAIGFLYNENIIQTIDEIVNLRVCPDEENIDVWLSHSANKPSQWNRTSGCTGGITGVRINESMALIVDIHNGFTLHPKRILNLVELLYSSQCLYHMSGGVHTSALSDGDELCVIAEDIGRHNTLDKLAGLYLMKSLELPKRILLTTGRISSEMLQKAARIGASIVISRTAPSSLAVDLAETLNVTLIGYARRDRFRVYTHSERIET